MNEPNARTVACARCVHFDDAPLALERAIPGLRTMSSGFAAVLGDDGVCRERACLVSARSRCAAFSAHTR